MTAAVLFSRSSLIVGAIVFALAGAACGDDSPTSPDSVDPPPTAGSPPPTTPPPSAPDPVGTLNVQVNPNPVPHSGARIPDAPGCANVQFTWFYDQVLSETGGSAITLTNRIDLFDERETNNRAVNIVVPANGSITVPTRWCSSNRAAHSAQTRWSGTDASGRSVTVMGPRVVLNAPS
jgi:hypothetical protein